MADGRYFEDILSATGGSRNRLYRVKTLTASPLAEEEQTLKIAPGGIDLGNMEIEVREK